MDAVVEGLLISIAVAWIACVLAALWVRHRVRLRLRIAPGVRTAAPTGFVVPATTAARLHRRLRRVSATAQLAGRLDPGLTHLADDLIAEALALEPSVLAVAPAGRAGSIVRRDLAGRIHELEAVGRRLTALAARSSRPASGEGSAHRVLERVAALEAARQELAEIDLQAGLVRHA